MTLAHDVFAETNPAFCAAALVAFTSAFVSLKEDGPELPVCYIALPIALSGELANTFNGTNRSTGLLEWLTRSTQVQIGLAARINASANIVTEAVRFGCFTRVLNLSIDGRIRPGTIKIEKSALKKLHGEPALAIKHAERLGYWFAMAGSTRTMFDMIGLTV
ncbi:hypothetical protein CO615_08795 [Lysobacteraceae bacterium NML75-0749]|nr:hypothetical protein CO615_08795 [Xanthomonadaceae bacterium NML75-0749]PJK05615.1 hypothetical protein CO609_01235 [Xanthomonadaceae bacterium NML91-0268]